MNKFIYTAVTLALILALLCSYQVQLNKNIVIGTTTTAPTDKPKTSPIVDLAIMPTPVPTAEQKLSQARVIKRTMSDNELIARVLYAEARGECNEGQRAIVKVILNRRESSLFGNTISEVIHRQGQFVIGGTYTEKELQNVNHVLESGFDMPSDVKYFGTWKFRPDVWGKIGNHYFMR